MTHYQKAKILKGHGSCQSWLSYSKVTVVVAIISYKKLIAPVNNKSENNKKWKTRAFIPLFLLWSHGRLSSSIFSPTNLSSFSSFSSSLLSFDYIPIVPLHDSNLRHQTKKYGNDKKSSSPSSVFSSSREGQTKEGFVKWHPLRLRHNSRWERLYPFSFEW